MFHSTYRESSSRKKRAREIRNDLKTRFFCLWKKRKNLVREERGKVILQHTLKLICPIETMCPISGYLSL